MSDEKDPLAQVPMSNDELQNFLSSGPSVSQSRPELPPEPQPVQAQNVPEMDPEMLRPKEKPPGAAVPGMSEGPDEEARKEMILPDDRTKAALKQQFGDILRVVPIPFSRPDNRMQTYVVRQLTRAQWRAMEDKARKSVAGGNVEDAESLF